MNKYCNQNLVLALVISVLSLQGCLPTNERVFDGKAASESHELAGHWMVQEGDFKPMMAQKHYVVSIFFDSTVGNLRIISSQSQHFALQDWQTACADDQAACYEAYPSDEKGDGGYKLISLYPTIDNEPGLYLVMAYQQDGDNLSVFNISDKVIEAAFKSGELIKDSNLDGFAKSGSKDLKTWLMGLKPSDFTLYAEYKRQK